MSNDSVHCNSSLANVGNNFKYTISKMNPLFEGIQANDAKDLISKLLVIDPEKRLGNKNDVNNNTNNESISNEIINDGSKDGFGIKNCYYSGFSDLFCGSFLFA